MRCEGSLVSAMDDEAAAEDDEAAAEDDEAAAEDDEAAAEDDEAESHSSCGFGTRRAGSLFLAAACGPGVVCRVGLVRGSFGLVVHPCSRRVCSFGTFSLSRTDTEGRTPARDLRELPCELAALCLPVCCACA